MLPCPPNSRILFVGADSPPDNLEIGIKCAASRPLGGWTKRALDSILALAILVVLSPLMLTVALLIMVTSPGGVIFSQRRPGFHARSFPCFKFRTMVNNAEEELRRYLENNPEAAREWGKRQKLRHDPRVTQLGQLLRKSSVDEIPQLFNVLRGEMSLVGPRPIEPSEQNRYREFCPDYFGARPGLTGMWQVCGRNSRTYQERLALVRYYVRRWSFAFDLWILFKTIPAVLRFDDAS